MHQGCAFSTLGYEVHEHEADAGLRLSSVAATLNYPHPIFSHPGIIRGLRSPLSAAADSPHTHPVSFLYCLSSTAYTFITPWANSPSPVHSMPLNCKEPPGPGGPALPFLSPETLGISPRLGGSILPWLQAGAHPGHWCHWQLTSCWLSIKDSRGDNAAFCGKQGQTDHQPGRS